MKPKPAPRSAIALLGLLLAAASLNAAEANLRITSGLRPATSKSRTPAVAPSVDSRKGAQLLSIPGPRAIPAQLATAAAPPLPGPPPLPAKPLPLAAMQPPVAEAREALFSEMKLEIKMAKQQQANVHELEQALKADVALLRESGAMEQAAATPQTRSIAQAQVRKTEQLVKDLSMMLKSSRASALQDARNMLQKASEVQEVANEMAKVAREQMKVLGRSPRTAAAAVAAPATAAAAAMATSQARADPTTVATPATVGRAQMAEAEDDTAEAGVDDDQGVETAATIA